MVSLEFGRYGAESLGKLVTGGKSIESIVRESVRLPRSVSNKLWLTAKNIEKSYKTDIVTTVDKFGRTIYKDKSGYKLILDKNGEFVYERVPKNIKNGDFLDLADDGAPVLRYRITRPNSAYDRTFMDVKLTQDKLSADNKLSGHKLVSYSNEPGKDSYHYRSENLFQQKLDAVVNKIEEVLKSIL